MLIRRKDHPRTLIHLRDNPILSKDILLRRDILNKVILLKVILRRGTLNKDILNKVTHLSNNSNRNTVLVCLKDVLLLCAVTVSWTLASEWRSPLEAAKLVYTDDLISFSFVSLQT
nr:At3g57160 [Arabidopsis thaliana]ABE66023.1 unknown [Arabidopsis thaliana]